jgi:hypothetical protein
LPWEPGARGSRSLRHDDAVRLRGTLTTTALLSAALLLSGCTGGADPRPTETLADGTAPATIEPSPSGSVAADPATASPSPTTAGSKGGGGSSGGTGSGGGSTGGGTSGGGSGGASKPPSAIQPCVDDVLSIRVAADPQRSERGQRAFRITFVNTGKVACTLRGYPQVGATGRGDRSPIGQPAEPDVRYTAKTERLAVGGSIAAILLADNIDANGGPYNDGDSDRCGTATGTGYTISPPESATVFWVPRDRMLACTTEVTWMHVTPVLVP